MDIHACAKQAGFAECYLLEPQSYRILQRRRTDGATHIHAEHLHTDARTAYPWANAIALLVLPYTPYARELHVSGYYVASNRAYHALNALLESMRAEGVRAERAEIPLLEAASQYGIGVSCKCGLTALPPYGTRVVFQAIAAALPSPAYAQKREPRSCADCGRCIRACPTGAIGGEGYDWKRCARAYMCGEEMPEWVMDASASLLGCEECQFACPLNAGIGTIDTLPDAFDTERLLRGDIKPVLERIGKNMKSGGRITAQAALRAAHEERGDLLPLLYELADDERPAVRSAARYAISHLQEA